MAYVIKHGIDIPSITSVSSAARHPDVLLAPILKMTSVLQNNLAGAIGWEAVNVFFAPFLAGLPYEKVKQLAQMLIFEFNQLAGGRGGQVAFTDINLYYEIPDHFRDVPALLFPQTDPSHHRQVFREGQHIFRFRPRRSREAE